MSDDIKIGDYVKLITMPEWLLHDLPEDEQIELRSFVGLITQVEDIDEFGYFWIGFGSTFYDEEEDCARYSGHSFAIDRVCIEPVEYNVTDENRPQD